MRGSLIHDALCQLIDLNLLPEIYQDAVNSELCIACQQDGMHPWIVDVVRYAVDTYFKVKRWLRN